MNIDISANFGLALQGRIMGRKHFAQLCELVSEVDAGEIVLLNFEGVDLVTGSWVNAALVSFIQWAADDQHDLFPLLCNLKAEWLDDFLMVAKWTHQCYLIIEGSEIRTRAKLLGSLDPGQRTTLEALLQLREVTGAELERQRSSEGIRATAWNNRLKDLHSKRLLRRITQGRQQVYSPIVEEVLLDGC